VWGRFASRGDPRALYAVVEVLQASGFVVMALARTLPELFLARLVLGTVGASSTFAFILAGRSLDAGQVRRRIAAVQSAMTVGQVVGPLAGAIAAARLGFRASFLVGAAILLACAALVRWCVADPGGSVAAPTARAGVPVRDVAIVAVIILGGSTQIFFLTAILPQILPPLGVESGRTLEVGGVLIFASGVAAALGALLAPRLGELVPERRLLTALLLLSSAFVGALALAGSVWLYGALRFLQVLFIAPVFPLIFARVAQRAGGQAIGFINSARIAAAFVGPVFATSMIAWGAPGALYLLLALVGVACVPLVGRREAART
jgi:MFS family permease